MICKLSEDTCRVAYGEVAGLSEEEMRGRAAERLEMILPGNPKPNDYDILRFSPFIMHQRCVEKMRVGRVMLVGDAAHLCNPMYDCNTPIECALRLPIQGLTLTGAVLD